MSIRPWGGELSGWWKRASGTALYRGQVVCLSHDQAARSGRSGEKAVSGLELTTLSSAGSGVACNRSPLSKCLSIRHPLDRTALVRRSC